MRGSGVRVTQAVKTGYRLVGVPTINAIPKDPEDPEDINVHRLQPDLAGPAEEHAKMRTIGESDRITLGLVKP